MKGFLVKSVIFFLCILLGFQGDLIAGSRYCFRFTWMGPRFSKEDLGNLNSTSSCRDTYDNCVDPRVVTNDGTTPNFTKLWEDYKNNPDQIACLLTPGFVCAKWTSYYDDAAEYTMHNCVKITVEGEPAMTSGCVTSVMNNSRTTEVCACSTYDEFPCNSGHHPYSSITVTGLLMAFCLVLKCVT